MSNRKRKKHQTSGEERRERGLKRQLLHELYHDIQHDEALRQGIMQLLDESRPAWTPWEDVTDRISSPLARELGINDPKVLLFEAWGGYYKDVRVYQNSRYFVYKRQFAMEIDGLARIAYHLSIKDQENTARHDWRDFQRIKNDLCGPEYEAVEVYPRESRLVDTSNQFFLWVFPEGECFPFGFEERCVMEDTGLPGSKQRRFEPDARPADLRTVLPEVDVARLQRIAKEVEGGRAGQSEGREDQQEHTADQARAEEPAQESQGGQGR